MTTQGMSFSEKHQSAMKTRANVDKKKVAFVLSAYSKKLKSPTQKSFLAASKSEGVSPATIDKFANLQFFEKTLILHQLDSESIKIKKAILCGLSGDRRKNRTLYKESYKRKDTRHTINQVCMKIEKDTAFWSTDIDEIPKTISLTVNNQTYSVKTDVWISFIKEEREQFKLKALNAYRKTFGKDAAVSSEPFSISIWRTHDAFSSRDEKRARKLFGSFTQFMNYCGIKTTKNMDEVAVRDLVDFVLEVWESLNIESKSLSIRDLDKYKSLKPDGMYFSVRKFSAFGSTGDQGLKIFSRTLAENIKKRDSEILAVLRTLQINSKRTGLYLVRVNDTLWKFGCAVRGKVDDRIIKWATELDGKHREAFYKLFAENVKDEETRLLSRIKCLFPEDQQHKKEFFHLLSENEVTRVKELLIKEEGFKVFDQW